jgi:hypothetical protein
VCRPMRSGTRRWQDAYRAHGLRKAALQIAPNAGCDLFELLALSAHKASMD